MARAMQKAGEGLGKVHILVKCVADNCSYQKAIKIYRKSNKIKHLILSQTLRL